MKRLFLTIMAALTLTLSASAQRLLDVRGEAQYITDKMALELALTPSQRNSILQLNLAYLDGITSYRDIETTGWKYRNKHMKALLTPAQWKLTLFLSPHRLAQRRLRSLHLRKISAPQQPPKLQRAEQTPFLQR